LSVRIARTGAVVVGGGTAGIAAAVRLAELGVESVVVEKADVRRSGCLAAGVNALNAHVGGGRVPSDYADYALADAHGVASKDLLLTMAERLGDMVDWLESIGLVFQKDERGERLQRGWRNLRVNGEAIKPLLAAALARRPLATVLGRHLAVGLLMGEGRCLGLLAMSLTTGELTALEAPAVIIATGGAAGLYRSPSPAPARHRIWYPPFNTGGGLAMAIEAGAEATTLEMRMVALRLLHTMAPTGTLALGVGAEQVNAYGRRYEADYGRTTSQRVLALRRETAAGRGPCRLVARVTPRDLAGLGRAYLDMCPTQTLKWLEEGLLGDGAPIEGAPIEGAGIEGAPIEGAGIEGAPLKGAPRIETLSCELAASEPYVLGGHTGGGLWVDVARRTTVEGLWAAGDVAGGAPQKFVTGALAEGVMAAESVASFLSSRPARLSESEAIRLADEAAGNLAPHVGDPAPGAPTSAGLEDRLQELMDLEAGGISAGYAWDLASLSRARDGLKEIRAESLRLRAREPKHLGRIRELLERLTVAESLVAHLGARRETRWPGFGEFRDHPGLDSGFELFVNSRRVDGEIEILRRSLDGRVL
jgi:adenylylsulfate reductase subunit A